MEGFVTTPVENALSGIDGIDYISSESGAGYSYIQVHMKLNYDINQATIDVSNKISTIRGNLPSEIKDPVIHKNNPDGDAVMYLSFSSHSLNPEELSDYLDRTVRPTLQSQTGVSDAPIFGGLDYAMRIWLDPFLMAAHQVTASDVQQALNSNNIQAAAGLIRSAEQSFSVTSNTDLHTASQFNHIVVRNQGGHLVQIKDIGHAELGNTGHTFSVIADGKPAIFIGIMPKSDANPLDISKAIHKVLPEIINHLPAGVKAEIFWDGATFISAALHDVQNTFVEACLLVFLVIFIMIGSFRAVLIPLITIPLSIIGAFAFMLALHYSINLLTLLAFVLAIGLVVDDSIVVLENIHRHIMHGLTPQEAAIKGAREISFVVITITFTLAAVYAPIGFMSGMTGKLFTEFAFTLASAVIVSGCIALTLSPMLCSKLYNGKEEGGFEHRVNQTFEELRLGYKSLLNLTLKYRYLILIAAFVVYISCYFFYIAMPKGLAPSEDQGGFMLMATGPDAANITYTENHTKPIGQILATVPEIAHYAIINGAQGVNTAFGIVSLTPWNQRKKNVEQILNTINPPLFMLPGIQAFAMNFPTLPGASSAELSFVIKTPADSYQQLNDSTQKLITAINAWGGLSNVTSSLTFDTPQLLIDVNRDLTSDLGISMQEINDALNISLNKPIITRFSMAGRSYAVMPELYPQYEDKPSAINNLFVRTQNNKLVPFSTIADVKEEVTASSLSHFQQLRSAKITAATVPNVSMGEAITKVQQFAKKTLPNTMQLDYAGVSRQYIESGTEMAETFIFSLLFIYLILSAQFESFKDPLIVMLSVPLAMAGALLVLLISGSTLNIYTEIGLITLIGLITKNGVLIVEFANQEQNQGIAFRDAIINAAATRLRPILMTTTAIILGALPLALATGANAISRRQLGLTIIGGMSFGTLLTLFVIPTAYYLMASKKRSTNKKH